jgi:hypothetical protein
MHRVASSVSSIPRRVSVCLGSGLALAVLALVAGTGCGDDGGETSGSGGSSGSSEAQGPATSSGTAGTGPEPEVLQPGADPLPGQSECRVEIRPNIPIAGNDHVELCTKVDYATNPPSSGAHWPRWAAFKDYDQPVRHEILVHDLEHGAIVMLHDCADCGTAITDAFEDAKDAHGIDQKCIQSGVTARFIVAPDPSLDFPIAIAAWGATYLATCIDPQSISAFVEAHYAGGPEDTCAAGVEPSSLICP